ncbi:MAG: hypothetical protein HQ506_01620 [Candidatus Marinimicrobia bacterium]|nr:hypothetical protein [Candidatus Neomarinimicrobiota bacterium]
MKTKGLKIVILTLMISLTIWGRGSHMEDNRGIIQVSDLEKLPEPVKRFMEYSQVVGTPYIKKATIKQTGLFKMAPDKSWTPFKATQIYNIAEASFEWKVRMKMAPLVIVKGTDALRDGCGSMKIKLFGLIPLVNAKGPEMDQGAMTRYLSEIIWFPQALLDDHISWEAGDSLSAKATFTIDKKSVEGVFYFNEIGQITRFECDRYATEGKDMVLRPWVTPVDKYEEMGGLRLGVRGRAIWKFPKNDFTYVDVEITDVVYE